ncbi:MAG: DUF4329 domain-containing protein [Cellvibrionaceae bacterium]|nr:DUF4329 domain-containing protein [Cellvibrionaceae bacterium]
MISSVNTAIIVKTISGLVLLSALILAAEASPQVQHNNPHQSLIGRFDSTNSAAIAAANAFNPSSVAQDREFIGAIYRCANHYHYSLAAGRRGSGKASIRVGRFPGCRVTAMWHTHGNENSRHRYFSDLDTQLAETLQVPFYMADYTGHLRIFAPGDKKMTRFTARKLGLGLNNGFATGSLVKDARGERIRIAT